MTVAGDDRQDDDLLAGLAGLRTRDVSRRRSRQLRGRCHALLQARPGATQSAGMMNGTAFQRVIGPALGGAWCVAYVAEIIRRVAMIYLGTQ